MECAEEEARVYVGIHDSAVLLICRLHISVLGVGGLGPKSTTGYEPFERGKGAPFMDHSGEASLLKSNRQEPFRALFP